MANQITHILIIGAGVIGLQTANDSLDKGYKVTILAKYWPGDEIIEYTSPWAGAIWHTQDLPDQVEVCDQQTQSYKYWMDILEISASEAEKMGIQRVPVVKYSVDEDNDPSTPRLWFSKLVQDFALVPASDLSPNGPQSGNSFTTYLTYLLTRAKSLGAKQITASLPASNSFANTISTALSHLDREDARIVVNCTGLGASKLCDENMFPIRGQTLLVRITPSPPTSRITVWDNIPVTYILPRRITLFSSEPLDSTFFIGGTNDKNNWDPKPTLEISKGILGKVKAVMAGWAGEDMKIEVLREQVGLRPGKQGGPRIELEEVDVGGKKNRVVHQYGHAGAGFQFAIGSVRKALALVEEILG